MREKGRGEGQKNVCWKASERDRIVGFFKLIGMRM